MESESTDVQAGGLSGVSAPSPAGPVADVLEALAWQEGEGVPRRVLPALVAAVTGRSLAGGDAAALLEHAAADHVDQSTSAGDVLYRLADAVLGRRLREHTLARARVTAAEIHARITDALLGVGRELGWPAASPYLRRTLPRHAALGGQVEQLCSEPGCLEAADPDAVLAVLPFTGDATMETYRRAAHALRGRRPAERALALDVAAVAADEPRRPPSPSGGPRVRWRHGPLTMHRQDLPGYGVSVGGVLIGAIDEKPVVVGFYNDGVVRVWDAGTGSLRLQLHGWPPVALGVIGDRPVIVTGGDPGRVWLWDARTGARLRAACSYGDVVNGVAFGIIDGQPTIVMAGYQNPDEGDEGFGRTWHAEGYVRMWDARTERSRGHMSHHIGVDDSAGSVALGVVDGEPVLASACLHGTVWLWAARTGLLRRTLGRQYDVSDLDAPRVDSLALGTVCGRPVVVTGGRHNPGHVWDAGTGDLLHRSLAMGQSVTGVALGDVVDQPVIVCGAGQAVHLWDPRTGRTRGEPLRHDWPVGSVACGTVEDRCFIAGGGGDTVRLWDAAAASCSSAGRDGGVGPVRVLAGTTVDGRVVIASAGEDGTVRMWEAATGDPYAPPLVGHDGPVQTGVFTTIDGELVMATGGRDGTVRLWDPRTGAPLLSPLIRSTAGFGSLVTSVATGVVDGQPVVISASRAGPVQRWNARTGECLGPLAFPRHRSWDCRTPRSPVETVAFGVVDGRPVVVGTDQSGATRLWDARTGDERLLRDTATHDAVIDEQSVLVRANRDRTIHLWDPATNRPWIGRARTGVIDAQPVAVVIGSECTVELTGRSTEMVLPVLSPINSVLVVDGGLAIGTASSLLVVDVPGLHPPPPAPGA